jgi:hypothetical protein
MITSKTLAMLLFAYSVNLYAQVYLPPVVFEVEHVRGPR